MRAKKFYRRRRLGPPGPRLTPRRGPDGLRPPADELPVKFVTGMSGNLVTGKYERVNLSIASTSLR